MLKIDKFEKKETREFKKENDNLESNISDSSRS